MTNHIAGPGIKLPPKSKFSKTYKELAIDKEKEKLEEEREIRKLAASYRSPYYKSALKLGSSVNKEVHHYTGEPCKVCATTVRYLKTTGCVACNILKMKDKKSGK